MEETPFSYNFYKHLKYKIKLSYQNITMKTLCIYNFWKKQNITNIFKITCNQLDILERTLSLKDKEILNPKYNINELHCYYKE